MPTSPRVVRSALDRLVVEAELIKPLGGRRVGLLANQASVTSDLTHAVDALLAAGVNLVRLFGPEHGLRGFAQDMEAVDEGRDAVSGLPVVSLYGADFDSLAPARGALADLDVVLVDVPDIGTRYYTFAATSMYLAQVARDADTEVWILDRPNPIGGVAWEGNLIEDGFYSFVGAISVPNRHGLTLAELLDYASSYGGDPFPFETVECLGWQRDQLADATGLPWVLPSPNMPTLDTAIIYPGMCLLEASNISEARGTTRPFELFGAPYIDSAQLTALLNAQDLPGVRFRQAVFKPGFQKWEGAVCKGSQVHVTDRDTCRPYAVGLAVLWAVRKLHPEGFEWREAPYEFVADVPAMDLLCGTDRVRRCLEDDAPLEQVLSAALSGAEGFEERRASVLRYGVGS